MSDRFVVTYKQGSFYTTVIFVDTETGVNYLMVRDHNCGSGGLTPLLDEKGTPVVSKLPVEGQNL